LRIAQEAAMMLANRLVRLIETHSEPLASSLLTKLTFCDKCRDFSSVPPEEFRQRVTEIYHNLGEWLLDKSELDIERRYREIGRRRAYQNVPLSQLIWAIALTKENLIEFLQHESLEFRPTEIIGELEVMQLLEQFFDRAVYFAAVGYEQARTMARAAAANY
jgi:hypothetical protein